MLSAVARTSMRARVNAQLVRGGGHHHIPSPNGMNLPFDTQKKSFKYIYWGSCLFFSSLPFVAAWWQIRKGNGNVNY